jgi:hypothetical protein
LGYGEYEDQVEEQLERGDPSLLEILIVPARGFWVS